MKHIAVISAFRPTKDNIGGPSAVPYYLLKHVPAGSTIDLYHFEFPRIGDPGILNEVNDLGLKQRVTMAMQSKPRLAAQMAKTYLRGLPPGVSFFPVDQKIVESINKSRPDAVWIYPHWLIDWAEALDVANVVVTGPDSSTLHSERVIAASPKGGNLKERLQRRLNENLEKRWGEVKGRVHVVGKADRNRLVEITGQSEEIFFSPLPHFEYVPASVNLESNSQRLKIVITGGGNTVYVGDHLERACLSLAANPALTDDVEFLFLGKGYEQAASILLKAGYKVDNPEWVDDYSRTLGEAHIQLFPIAVGTGTKCKVLQAFAIGLLCIGSELAFENIDAQPGKDYALYKTPEDLPAILGSVLDDLAGFRKMAASGSEAIRNQHSPERAARLFWNEVFGNN